MRWGKHGRSGPRGYHHGNLKEALVRAALDLIAEKGPAGFTFADAARWAGVVRAAPYRHFRDRDELLADVARQGFERFAASSPRPGTAASPTRAPRSTDLGKAYLAFARTEPAYYSAMFEAGIPHANNPDLRAAGERAFGDPARSVRSDHRRCCRREDRPPAMMMALHIWALSHGIASLFGRGDKARRTLPMPPEELLEAAMLIYLRGLGGK